MAILEFRNLIKIEILQTVVLGLMAFSMSAYAADNLKLDETKIQAGLVYNFLKYTTWPTHTFSLNNNLNVCLLGGDPFGGNLFPLDGRTAQKYEIKVKVVNSTAAALDCQIVYINKSQESRVESILQELKGQAILTMSNIKHFSQRGGMVELTTGEDERIHLYVSREAIDSGGLVVASRLLNLAELERTE